MRISDWSADVCASDLPVPGRIAAVDEAVPYRIRPLDQMLEILEAIFDPGDLGQRQRHVDADLQEAVAHRHLDPHVGRKPADPHHVGDMAMDIERSDERRVGKECVSTYRSRWSQYHKKEKQHT